MIVTCVQIAQLIMQLARYLLRDRWVFFTRSRVYLSAEQNVAIDRVSGVKLIVSQSSRSKSWRVGYTRERIWIEKEKETDRKDVIWRGARFGTSRKPGGAFEYPSSLISFVSSCFPRCCSIQSHDIRAATWYILFLVSFLSSLDGSAEKRLRPQLGVKRLY